MISSVLTPFLGWYRFKHASGCGSTETSGDQTKASLGFDYRQFRRIFKAMSPLPLIVSPRFQAAISSNHRFPMGKYGAVQDVVSARDWVQQAILHPAQAVTPEQAGLAHDPDYIARLVDGTLLESEVREIGLPQNPSVAVRSFTAAGATLMACRLALRAGAGLAGSLAGGSHHANRAGGRGFCVMNDVGVALSIMLSDPADQLGRALVVDLDVHQGDGTAEIFADQPRVFTASLHCEDNYPFTKALSDCDVGLAAGTGDSGYLPALDHLLHRLDAQAVAADLIVYNAGVDPHRNDRLGRLDLSDAGLAQRDQMVFEWARAHRKPLCLVLGGGYDRDIAALAERHARVFDRLFHAHNDRT